jgi:beta-exotoxin I transport system ATP-binding protein
MNVIETRGLTKYYNKSRGVVDLNLQIKEGEIFGFIGPNGAGKSTTIRLLLNLLFPTRGEGKIFNYDIIKDSPGIKQLVGYVPSEIYYYSDMSVGELFEYSARYYSVFLGNYYKKLIDKFDLDLSQKIVDLSMGNKKKVAIVQSLLHKPRLLILDEPTSGLDPLMQNQFFEIIKETNDMGTTIFFSSHILREVEKICHRVAIIKDGIIIKEDDIKAIKARLLKRVSYQIKKGSDVNPSFLLPGIISIEEDLNGATFLYQGELNILFKKLSEMAIERISILEPDLEEIFMHYYNDKSSEGEH